MHMHILVYLYVRVIMDSNLHVTSKTVRVFSKRHTILFKPFRKFHLSIVIIRNIRFLKVPSLYCTISGVYIYGLHLSVLQQTFIEPFDVFITSLPIPHSSNFLIAFSAPSLPPLCRNFFFLLTSEDTSRHLPGRVSTNASLVCIVLGDVVSTDPDILTIRRR